MSRIVSVIVAGAIVLSLFIVLAPKAYCDDDNTTTTPLGISYPYMRSDIVVDLLYVEVGDHQKGNTYPSTPLDRVNWFRLYYRFENRGDHAEVGYLKAEFYDEEGNVYKPTEGTYTGDTVAANSTGSVDFIEIPVQKGSNIVKINVIQGFDQKSYYIPRRPSSTPGPTVIPTPPPPTPTAATAQPTAAAGAGTCFPLLPFAVLGAVGLAGLAAGKKSIKK